MALSKGVVGYAMYFELRKTIHTQQMLLIPPFVDPASGQLVPANLLARQINEGNDKRTWRFRDIKDVKIEADDTTKAIKQIKDMDQSLAAVTPILDVMKQYVHTAVNGGFSMTGEPIIVEMTRADAKRVQMVKTPEALVRRMLNARKDLGYPEALVTSTDELKKAAQKAASK